MKAISALLETVHRLRAPGGCPWDQKQTHQSLRPYMIEEAYEAVDVLDRVSGPEALGDEGIRGHLIEELGDVLMQVLIHSEIASEAGAFSFDDVAEALNAKLVRRHPHVFGDAKATNADEAYQNWEQRKALEKPKDAGVLSGLPRGMPALERTERAIEKVTQVGFQWPDPVGPRSKINEEIRELDEAVALGDGEKIRGELGDVLFSVCNYAFMLKQKPSEALRECLQRFEGRFTHMERAVKGEGRELKGLSLDEMDQYWQRAKAEERRG